MFRYKMQSRGLTLLELLIALAIVGVLVSVGYPAYTGYIDKANANKAVTDMINISLMLDLYHSDNDQYPESLAEIDMDGLKDPWGNSYEYLNIATVKGNGKLRKDRNLVPINTDFDLYSKGPDGRSVSPLTSKLSRDDIVRAGNGSFYGVAEDY